MNVYTDDATFMIDGYEQQNNSKLGTSEDMPQVFVGTDGSDTIMVLTKQGPGGIEVLDAVDVIGPDGSDDIHMESIMPGVLVEIKSTDVDPSSTAAYAEGANFDYYEEDQDAMDKEPPDEDDKDQFQYNEEENPNGRQLVKEKLSTSSQKVDRSLQSSCSSFKVIEVAIAFDSSFCAREGGSVSSTKSSVQNIVAAASVYYQRQGVCTKIMISHLEGNCSSGADPYRSMVSSGDMTCSNASSRDILRNFKGYWRQNRSSINRDAAHLFFSKTITGRATIGCAGTNGLCRKDHGYGVNNVGFTSQTHRRAHLFAHELGHNVGLPDNSGNGHLMGSVGSTNNGWTSSNVSQLKSKLNGHSCVSTEGGHGNCRDSPESWHDSDGPMYDCDWYSRDGNCAKHGNGFANRGKTANQACCACGGGSSGTGTGSDLNKFNFFPLKDSSGNDIGNRTGGVEVLAKLCSSDPNCRGFNSNGWLKHTIRNQSQWSTWTSDPTKGLYVKK